VRWIAFVALSIVAPIVANGLRAFGLLVLAEISGSSAMVMADHIIYGWVFFTFVTFILILIGRSFADRDGSPRARRAGPGQGGDAASPAWRLAAAAVIGLGLAAVGPAYAQILEWRTRAIDLAAASPPGIGAAWRAISSDIPWQPAVVGPDRDFLGEFANENGRVVRYVALYRIGGLHDNLARGLNEIADFRHWRLAGSGRARATIGGKNVTVDTTELESKDHRLQVWDFYLVGGRIVAGRAAAKLAQLRGLLGGQDRVAAFVAVAAEDGDPHHPAAASLARFLDDMAPLAPYAHRLGGGRPDPSD
jgi:EpsI family protein